MSVGMAAGAGTLPASVALSCPLGDPVALRASPRLSSTRGRSPAECVTPGMLKKREGGWGGVPWMHHMHLSGPHGPRHPMQILREHVMVRVGGGWDTLEHYLDKHDPCRCTSLCESPRPQIPCFCPMTGVRGGVHPGSRCFWGHLQEQETSLPWSLSTLLGNVWFWGLSLALVATRGHGRLLDGAGPQKLLCGDCRFAPASPGGWMVSDGWVGCTPGGWCVCATDRGAEPPPLFPTAHKQALKTRTPQQQVQHEVRLCPTSKAAARGQSQPALLVSRSQSPLPPVAWGSRVLSGPRSPATPSPEGSGRPLGASPRQEPAQPRRVPSGR